MTFWVAGAIGGGAILSTLASSKASSAQQQSASEATQAQRDISGQQTEIQRDIAEKQLALQREQYLKQLELNEPFRQGGLTGQNMLLAQLQGPYGSAKFGGVPGYDPASAMQNFGGVAGYDPASAMRNFGAADFQADPGYESDGEREKLKNDRQSTDGESAMVCLLQTVSVPDQAENLFVFISA